MRFSAPTWRREDRQSSGPSPRRVVRFAIIIQQLLNESAILYTIILVFHMRQPIYIASSPAPISNNFARGSLFKVFNFIAYEMTTLRMVQDLSLAPEEDFRVGVDEKL